MLGIRRYRSVAIDLFQGGPDLFEADAWIDAGSPLREHGVTGFVASLVEIDSRGVRHGAIRPDSLPFETTEGRVDLSFQSRELDAAEAAAWRADSARLWMAAVRSFLDGERVEGGLARLTFLLPDKAWYTTFRDALFSSFADTP